MNTLKKIKCTIAAGFFAIFFPGCEKALDLKDPSSNSIAVFDEAWNIMDQQYTMFSLKGINWANTYTEYRSRITNDVTDKTLFRELSSMLETLRDGHVSLIAPFDTATYENFRTAFPANFNFNNIVNRYLNNNYKTSGPVIYSMSGNIGYLYYNSFRNEISDKQLDTIFDAMAQTKGLIIDVRNNAGGNSSNVDKLFQRFISSKKIVKYEVRKKGPGHNDFSDPEPYYLVPQGTIYSKPTIILTNRSCYSACNDYVMYMSDLPNVTSVGDQTGGGGSIPNNYVLGNGWKIQYSASITLSPANVNIEDGIKPSVSINITLIDQMNGKDPILEKAFLSLQ